MLFAILNLLRINSWSPDSQKALIYIAARLLGYTKENAGYLVAQATHETGNFGSDLFRRAANAYGMRKANKRKQSIKGTTTNSYVTYYNVVHSLYDRFLWDKYNNIYPSERISLLDYVYRLKRKGYFEADKISYHAQTAVWLADFNEKGSKVVLNTLAKLGLFILSVPLIIYWSLKWKN